MNRAILSRGRTLATTGLLAVLLSMPGCDGDTGAAGAAGPAGPAGPSAPPGPIGSPGGVPITSAERINVEFTGISIPAGGGAPTVALTLTNDLDQGLTGLPAANIRFVIAQLTPGSGGGSSAWQSYITRDSAGIPDAQATTETATDGTYVDKGDGTYEYTFALALTDYPAGPAFDEAKTHRVGIEIRTNSEGFLAENIPANNAPLDFVPTGGAPTFTRLIADNDTCNACHDNLELHGEARFDVEYCVQCHNPFSIDGDTGNSVDMKVMVHKIHYGVNLANGYQIIGFGDFLHDYSNVVFPQDVRNCRTCHEESDPDTPEAANWRLVANREACGTCHDDIDWANAGHPGGFTFNDDTQCLDCHGPNGTVTNDEGKLVQTPIAHELAGQLASTEFSFNVLGVTNTGTGEFPAVTFSVTDPSNNDAPYDIGADPEFTACDGTSRLAVDIAWDTADFTNRDTGNAPSQPISINPLPACGGASTDNLDGTFTVTSSVVVPATVSGTLAAALEGHPWRDLDGDGLTSNAERIAVTNGVTYEGIAGAAAEPRRSVVDIEKCDECHNRLSLHGSNRTDKPEVCATCHNPNATDVNRRAGDCLTAFGADDVAIDFKYMVHAIHASGYAGVPYNVCGFGNNPVTIDFVYPGRLNNCEGCHLPDAYFPVDGDAVLGTTVDAGADLTSPTDDTVISPNTAVCSACHATELAAEHMRQNGGDFEATKAADSTLISSGVETCELCHGPGRSADVKEVHGVGTFRFN